MEYRLAPEAQEIGRELIREHHKHLAPIRVEYVFGEKVPESGGKEVWGRARKITGLGAFFSADARRGSEQPENWSEEPEPFFVIEIAKPIWDKLEEPGRHALVDHELCFPAGTSVAGPEANASSTRWYSGELVEIRTAAGHFLSGTPNHPILTRRGWVPLGLLKEGDRVVGCDSPERVASGMDPDKYQMPAAIEEVASSVEMRLALMPEAAHDLNADAPDSQVNVVAADSGLMSRIAPSRFQHPGHVHLGGGDGVSVSLAGLSHLNESLIGMLASPPRVSPGMESVGTLFGGHSSHPIALGLASTTERNPPFPETALEDRAVNAHLLRERIQRSSPSVFLDKIINVNVRAFSGHVYNLQTSQSWYIANNIVTHNCHCGVDVEKGTLVILPHYIEEFPQIVQRHGLWRGDVEVFARASSEALEQLSLLGDDREKGEDSDEVGSEGRVSQIAHEAVEQFREDHAAEIERGEVDAWVGSRS